MSKDITPRINRIHANIWKDVANRLTITTITKLLWLGLPKLQHGVAGLDINISEPDTLDIMADIAKLLPNIKNVYMYRSEHEEQDVCSYFARFIDVVRDRNMTIEYRSSGILQNYIKNTLLKMNCLSTIMQFTLPHFIPTSMTLVTPREKVPDSITNLHIFVDDFDEYEFTNVTSLTLVDRISDYNIQSVNDLFERAPSSLTKLTYTTYNLSSPIILPESVVELQLSFRFDRPLLEITRNISILHLSVYIITENIVKYLSPHITNLTMNAYKIDNISLLNLIPSTTKVKIYMNKPCDCSSIIDKYTVIHTNYRTFIKSRISY